MRAPSSSVRDDLYRHARTEFERHRHEANADVAAWHIKSGTNEFLLFGRYLDQQRFFVRPTSLRQRPEKRVAMLKNLKKVAVDETRPRIDRELAQAEEQVRMKERGELSEVAEGAREFKRKGVASFDKIRMPVPTAQDKSAKQAG